MNLIFALLFSIFAQSAEKMPVVSQEQFVVGNTWFWAYYEKDSSQIYSTERYQVVEVQGTKLTFEIWTLYAGKSEYTPSARFSMDLQGCWKAFNTPYKQGFQIDMRGVENGSWSQQSYKVGSTAFEEKFNCNPKYYDLFVHPYKTIKKEMQTQWGNIILFQQLPRGNSQLRAFYFYDHPKLRGIAYEKTFNPETSDFFEMRLIDWSMK